MAPALLSDDPAPEDFADPDLAPVFETLPPNLKRRFRADFLTATRETAPSLFTRVEAEMFYSDIAEKYAADAKQELHRAECLARLAEKHRPKKPGAKPRARRSHGR